MKCRKCVFYVKAFISSSHFVTEHMCFDAWPRKHGRGDLGGVSKSHCGQFKCPLSYVWVLYTKPHVISDISFILLSALNIL